ncbi:zinc ribbon domain-containing protein [Desulfofundulus salinus]|uniref:zinc ribbon domain-containing protein n=1 Tax=Desulfofundulus salinus TaxID=2419843 RepID=UPI00338E3B88
MPGTVSVVAVDPTGTSAVCAACDSPVDRITRHKAFCRECGCIWHADANAALNILLEGPAKRHGVEAETPAPVALRWNRYHWVPHAKSVDGYMPSPFKFFSVIYQFINSAIGW